MYSHNWKQSTKINEDKKQCEILFFISGGGVASRVASILSAVISNKGYNATSLICDSALAACAEGTIHWDKDPKKYVYKGPPKLSCYCCKFANKKTFNNLGLQTSFISQFITEQNKIDIRETLKQLKDTDLEEFSIDNINIGEQARAGVLRFYATGDLIDPQAFMMMRRYLKAGLETYYALKNYCSSHKIDCIVVDHGLYIPMGVVCEFAKANSIRLVVWHTAYRKKTFIFSHGDTYHKTLMNEDTKIWENLKLTENQVKETLNYLLSRKEGTKDWISFLRIDQNNKDIRKQLEINDSKPIVLLLTNVYWDAQLHYRQNVFSNMREWLSFTIKQFLKRTDINLVIRIHPAEKTGTLPTRQKVEDMIRKEFGELPSHIKIVKPESGINTYKIADESTAIVVYGTKMGVEFAPFGKQVIVCGEAWVKNKGITFDPKTKEEYRKVLNKLPKKFIIVNEQRALKYAYHFFFRRMVPIKSIKQVGGNKIFEIKVTDSKHRDLMIDKGLNCIADGIIHGSEFVYLEV